MISLEEAKKNWSSMGPVLAHDYLVNNKHEHTTQDLDELGVYLSNALGMIGEKLYTDAKVSSDGPISEMQEPFREMFASVRDAFLEMIGSIGARPEQAT